MKVYTYSKTRENLAKILDLAATGEEIRIQRQDGQLFRILLIKSAKSPFDVEPVNSKVTKMEIVSAIHEGRRT